MENSNVEHHHAEEALIEDSSESEQLLLLPLERTKLLLLPPTITPFTCQKSPNFVYEVRQGSPVGRYNMLASLHRLKDAARYCRHPASGAVGGLGTLQGGHLAAGHVARSNSFSSWYRDNSNPDALGNQERQPIRQPRHISDMVPYKQ